MAGSLRERACFSSVETFSRRSWPAGCACPLLLLSGILRRRSSHSSSALPSCEATRPATAEGLAFWRWVPPAVQGPLRPTSMARGCQEQGSPRSLKRPRAARPSLPPGSGWSRWTRPPLPGFTHVPRQALRTPALAQRSAVRPTPSWRAPKGRERRSLSPHRPFAGPSQGTGPGHAPA